MKKNEKFKYVFPIFGFLKEGLIDKKEEIGPSRRRVAGSWQAGHHGPGAGAGTLGPSIH